jgi:3-deoxy-D-manno-octulosonic-acid transferase
LPAPDSRLLVAGSTWPADEGVLLDALVRVRERHPGARLLVAPHEPTPSHLEALEREVGRRGLVSARWTPEGSSADVVAVATMGVLAGLYPSGAVAYVGGGFGVRGIHSVLEPAAWARPVLIGPNDRGVRDAALLAEAGGLVRLPERDPDTALAARWSAWLDDPDGARRDGAAARAALEPDRGAAARSATLVSGVM